MIKISNPFSSVLDYLSQSISRMIMITFVFVLLLPIAFLLPSLNKNIWEEVHNDNLVKHKLLATSLVEPIKLHIDSYQSALKLLGNSLKANDLENSKETQVILNNFANSTDDIVALSLLLTESGAVTTGTKNALSRNKLNTPTLEYISAEKKYRKYDKENTISSVFKSSISNKSVFLISHHILDSSASKQGTLIAEIGLGFVQKICRNISFGVKGHCAIVDDKGGTISHPNSAWVSQIHNLSQDKIVQKIREVGVGELEYYSSANQEEMIGGFAKVDKLGWGIMVLQPQAEIDLPFKNILTAILSWVIVGIVTALLIAFFVTKKITQPLSVLVTKSKELSVHSETFRLGEVPKSSPIEIRVLWNTISKLIVSFQEANAEVKMLSQSLNKNLRKVVVELRESNLKKTSNKDLLTGITNKVCFERELSKALLIRKGEDVGVILVDVDNFEDMVTKKGQDLGNFVIKHVAGILSDNIRSADMVARYNDSAQFVIYINYSTQQSLQGTTDKLRLLAETNPVLWNGDSIYLSLSIGMLSQVVDDSITVESLMLNADEALKKAKSKGQNKTTPHQMKAQA